MIQIATDPSQSARLIACGVDPKSADMYLEKSNLPPVDYYLHTIAEGIDKAHWFKYRGNRDIIPAWSLSALLALLPTTITQAKTTYYLDFAPYKDKGWGIGYFSTEGIRQIKGLTQPSDPIEACVKAIEYLTQKGYKLNEINQ